MAVFVFLAAAAGAEIVAADFRAGLDGHGTLLLSMAGRCCGTLLGFTGQIAAALAVVAGLTVAFGHGALHFGLGRLLLSAFGLLLSRTLLYVELSAHQSRDHLHVEIVEHILEEVERLYLVDYQRILLLV